MGNSVCGNGSVTRSSSRHGTLDLTSPPSPGLVTAQVLASPSSSPKNGKDKYVGAYGKLLDFLKECRAQDVISPARYTELLSAVDDLGGANAGAVSSSHKFFHGNETDFASVLPAMGIDIRRGTKDRAQNNNNGFFRLSSNECNLTEILEDSTFNSRSRTRGFRADVPLVLHGFIAHYNLIQRYNLDPAVLGAWIEAIGMQYSDKNPYHNWMHAVDVFQFCHLSIFGGGAGDFLNFQDVFALLAAAIAHDVRHPGVNNAFLVSSGAPLAITYNDKSVLENMHASVFFETLREPGNNFLEPIASVDLKTFRGKVIDAILATDMGVHFELVDKLTARLSKDKTAPFITDTKGSKEKQKASKSDRRLLVQIFMHMADLGHTCRPWKVHKKLVVDLEEEFFLQGDKEKELGIPVMPMMDRSKDSAATGQGFFLEKLVNPLLEPFCHFLSTDLAKTLQDNLADSKERWSKLVEVHGKKTARELVVDDDDAAGTEECSTAVGQSQEDDPGCSSSCR